MKLKTLKDLEVDEIELSKLEKEPRPNIIWSDDLKQEAIKRYKYWMKVVSAPFDESTMVYHMNIYGRMAEIKEFNNLTEEDLK